MTKIMLLHGVLDEIQDHLTWWLVDGTWKTFKYVEPFSYHNHAKHWVDNVNNCHHDPIGLEEAWATNGDPIENLHSYCWWQSFLSYLIGHNLP